MQQEGRYAQLGNYDSSLYDALANRPFYIYFIFTTVSWGRWCDNPQITDK